MAKLDEEIDRLFQLPLTEFTAARDALAKDAGKDGAGIKALVKPPVAAWAVNQLYWKNRDVHDALIDTAVQMRKAHKSVMEGKSADLRVAGKMHEEAVEAALRTAVALMKDSGQPVTDTTRHAILNTLRALPGEEPPGRLTQTLAPGGFEMLAGINIQGPPGVPGMQGPPGVPRKQGPPGGPRRSATGPSKVQAPAKSGREEREAVRAREQKLALERAVREADQKARHAEFEAARAARETGKAEKKLEEAQHAYEAAREAMKDAERDAKAAAQGKERADRRVREAQSALDAVRAKLESA